MAEHAPLPGGRRSPLEKVWPACLMAGGVLVVVWTAAAIVIGWVDRREAAQGRRLAERYQPGDFDVRWEGRWSWEDQTSRITFQGATMTLENFPVSGADGKLHSICGPGTFGPPQWDSAGQDMAIPAGTDRVGFPLFITCSLRGEPRLRYACSSEAGQQVVFRRVASAR